MFFVVVECVNNYDTETTEVISKTGSVCYVILFIIRKPWLGPLFIPDWALGLNPTTRLLWTLPQISINVMIDIAWRRSILFFMLSCMPFFSWWWLLTLCFLLEHSQQRVKGMALSHSFETKWQISLVTKRCKWKRRKLFWSIWYWLLNPLTTNRPII